MRCLALLLLLAPAASSQTLVAHFKLDETSGNQALDEVAGNHGTWQPGFTLGQSGGTCTSGLSTQLDGLGSYATVQDVPALNSLRNDLSVAAWVRTNSTTGIHRVFGNDGSWSFGTNGANLRFTTRGVLDYDTQGAGLQAGTWTHIAAVMDASNDVQFYVNGAPLALISGAQPAQTPQATWRLGSLNSVATEYWDGWLDEVRVYAGTLTPAQVQALAANACIGVSYCTSTPNSTGAAATLYAQGDTSLAADSLTLTCVDVPNNFGAFIHAAGQHQLVFGNGFLCVSGSPTVLYPLVLGVGGIATHTLSPLAMGLTPGPRNFQYWYRDPLGLGTSMNLSDGCSILFVP